jgi:transposase
MQESITYVGLDAHKKEHVVAILSPAQRPQVCTVRNTRRDIERLVRTVTKRAAGGVEFCYEAGVCGFELQRRIEAAGGRCRVIAPSLVPVRPGRRVKTDRRDARKLAELLRAGMLTEIAVPSEEEESIRDLCRCRGAAQRDLVRIRHQLSKFLLRRGYVYRDGRQWTQKHVRWISAIAFERPRDQQVLSEYLLELEHRRQRVASLTESLEETAEGCLWSEQVGWLRCFRGIDTVTALSILAELHGVGRFDSPRQLMSYLGLTPSEESSGDTRRTGGITKAGNRRVRRLLVEASWHQRRLPRVSRALARRRQGQPAWVMEVADRAMKRLHRRYRHLVSHGKLPSQAVTAVCREFAGFVWAVLNLEERSVPRRRIPRHPPQEIRPQPGPPGRMTAAEFFGLEPAQGAGG